jgi:hypothetical protein
MAHPRPAACDGQDRAITYRGSSWAARYRCCTNSTATFSGGNPPSRTGLVPRCTRCTPPGRTATPASQASACTACTPRQREAPPLWLRSATTATRSRINAPPLSAPAPRSPWRSRDRRDRGLLVRPRALADWMGPNRSPAFSRRR